jgi:5-methylthioadenosine/S-adenosylhomocysteine deaminase
VKILIEQIDEIYTGEDQRVIKNGYILILDNRIEEIGEYPGFTGNKENIDKIIYGKGKIALPGFINTHTHGAMTLLRGYADDLPLQSWLENKIWPFEAKLTGADIYWGTMLAILEMIRNGTTTFADMYFKMELVARAVEETGIRAVLAPGLIEMNDGEEGLKEALDFCLNWQGKANGRITTMLAPHAPYTCSGSYLKKIIELSHINNLPINIHVAETKTEYENSIKDHGLSPVKYLNEIGLLDRPVLAAHCVYLDKEDINILAQKNVGVAHNPCSNLKLGSGVAPVVEMFNTGINIGFGTDGVASNNNLDLIEEARIGAYLQKGVNLDPTVLDIFQLLEMVTERGSKALMLKDTGLLKTNYLADIILVDVRESSHYYPHHNNLSHLFYAGNGRDVDTVLVNGQVIYENRNFLTLDEERIYYEVENLVKMK